MLPNNERLEQFLKPHVPRYPVPGRTFWCFVTWLSLLLFPTGLALAQLSAPKLSVPAQSKRTKDYRSWCGFRQQVNANTYQGKRFRLKAAVKAQPEDLNSGWVQLFARVNNIDGSRGFFYNMNDQHITDPEWRYYTIEGQIDREAKLLTFGGMAIGRGRFLLDDFQLYIEAAPNRWEPIPIDNGSFEAGLSSDEQTGWTGDFTTFQNFSMEVVQLDPFAGKQAMLIEGRSIPDPFELSVPPDPIPELSPSELEIYIQPFDYFYLEPAISFSNVIHDIAQDSLGFIWLTVGDGSAVKYDGTSFRYYKYLDPETGTICKLEQIYTGIESEKLWFSSGCGPIIMDLLNEQLYREPLLRDSLPPGPVNGITRDDDGEIWISITDGGTFRYQPGTSSLRSFSIQPIPNSNFTVDQTLGYVKYIGGNLFCFTDHYRSGIYLYDKTAHRVERLPYGGLSSPATSLAAVDGDQFWIASAWGRGVSRYSLRTGTLTNYRQKGFIDAFFGQIGEDLPMQYIPDYHNFGYNLSDDEVSDILYTTDGRLLAATTNGINLYLPGQNGFVTVEHRSNHPQSSSGNQINCLFEDRDGNVWAGTNAGIRVQWRYKQNFSYYEIALPEAFYGHRPAPVSGILPYDQDRLLFWNTSDFYLYDQQNKKIDNLRTDTDHFNFLKDYPINYVYRAKDGTLWIGTDFVSEQTGNYALFRYDPDQRLVIAKYHYMGTSNGGLTKYATTAMTECGPDEVWIGTSDGANRLQLSTGVISRYQPSPTLPNTLSHAEVSVLYTDQRDQVWIGTAGGGLNLYRRATDDFIAFKFNPDDPNSISSNVVYAIAEDAEHRLWIATDNGLNRYDPVTSSFHRLLRPQPDTDNTFYSLLLDDQGYLWSSTHNELCRIDPSSGQIAVFNAKNGLGSPIYSRTGWQDESGQLYFGGMTGVVYFDPSTVNASNPAPPVVVITEFLLSDQPLLARDAESVLDRHITHTSELILKHWQNVFTIKYAALDYLNPSLNQYEYQLEGSENSRRQVGNKTEATYNNLSPGTYTFRVWGSNNDGIWSDMPATLTIRILPPWYWSFWSKLGYALLLAGLLYTGYRFQLRRRLAAAEAERLRELDEVKTRLYANITHEFRTPLTIILGMADKIAASPTQWLSQGVSMIRRNGQNLLRLVNQLLDLSKVEAGKLELQMVQGDVIQYLRYILESFESLGATKNVRVHFHTELEHLMMDYDPDNLLNVVSNLLSNAVKFTESGGDVYLIVQRPAVLETVNFASSETSYIEGNEYLQFKVVDTGIGISTEQLPFIFDRFYQSDDSITRPEEGTGIGLALARELVKLMGGRIDVKSQEGTGSEFTVTLPCRQEAPIIAPAEQNAIKAGTWAFTHPRPTDVLESSLTTVVDPEHNRPTVLIVEDNSDVIQYLVACLESKYQLEIAHDGQEGIDRALELVPDLIVSDVMMPEKDGFALCHTLKNDLRTSHIPIILLTAKADVLSRIAGLRRGADAYLAKPFNEAELQVRLQQLLVLREKLREKYSGTQLLTVSATTEPQADSSLEDKFIARIRQVVETHLDDYDLDVSKLCREMGMSRTPLHNKLKALTDMSTTEFIRYIRLEHARELLESTDLQVSEIAFRSGFRNANYFSTRFAALFDLSPTEYRAQAGT